MLTPVGENSLAGKGLFAWPQTVPVKPGKAMGWTPPTYQDSVKKSKRADIKGVLLGLANSLEQRFTETNSYVGAAGITGAYYTVTIAATANSYTLSAAPTGVQSTDKCGALTLTHTGVKDVTGAATGFNAANCW